jgi:hypothetical protein
VTTDPEDPDMALVHEIVVEGRAPGAPVRALEGFAVVPGPTWGPRSGTAVDG